MNELTSQSMQSLSTRVAPVSTAKVEGKASPGGNNLPPSDAGKIDLVPPKKIVLKSGDNSEKSKGGANADQREDIKIAVSEMNDYTQSIQRDLQFNLDEQSGRTVVTVVDSESKEVVRQIPGEVFLKMARKLNDDLSSGNTEAINLLDAKA